MGFSYGMADMYSKTMGGLGLIEGGTPSILDIETLHYVERVSRGIYRITESGEKLIIAEDNANNTITTEDMGYEYQYHVIPEFPSLKILLLFMIATLMAVAVYRRKLKDFNSARVY